MIYSPTNLSPSSGIAIDAATPTSFFWQYNGVETQTDYQIQIYSLENVLVYDSTKINSGTASHTVPGNSLTNNNTYKWELTVWASSSSVNSGWVVFKTNSSPTLTMNTIPNPVSNQNYTFTATYSQAEGIPIKNFKFILYDELGEEILNSGLIESQTVEYLINGLNNLTTYQIECIGTTQNDMIARTEKITFNTSYTMPDDIPAALFESLSDIGAIRSNWTNITQILGSVVGNYNYDDNGKYNKCLYLEGNSVLSYSINVPLTFTATYWIKLPSGFSGDFQRLGTDFRVGYDGEKQKFYYEHDYRITAGIVRELPLDFFFIGVLNNRIIIITGTYTEILV